MVELPSVFIASVVAFGLVSTASVPLSTSGTGAG